VRQSVARTSSPSPGNSDRAAPHGLATHWERLLQLPPKWAAGEAGYLFFVGQMNQPLLAQGVKRCLLVG